MIIQLFSTGSSTTGKRALARRYRALRSWLLSLSAALTFPTLQAGMVEAVYQNDERRLQVELEGIDVMLKGENVLNYPGMIEFAGDLLVLPYGEGVHGLDEIRTAAISRDGGRSWEQVADDSPFNDDVQVSGQVGYLKDGTVLYVDAIPIQAKAMAGKGLYYVAKRIKEPRWRVRRFAGDARLLETFEMSLTGLPWEEAAYLSYGHIIELPDGDLIAAFECVPDLPERKDGNWEYYAKTLIAKSSDGGRHFELLAVLEGEFGEHGLFNADLVRLANGDLLCVMRTGSETMLYQARSTDNGKTWTAPEPTGWWGVKPSLRLLDNGILVCTSGRGPFGSPHATYTMFSLDGEGKRWEFPFVLSTGPGCGYTSNLERDGTLQVFFSHSSYSQQASAYGLPFQSIKRATLRLKVTKPEAD